VSTGEIKPVQNIDTAYYSYGGFNCSFKLMLMSNGEFIDAVHSFSCIGGGSTLTKTYGKYVIEDSTLLTLFPVSIETLEYIDYNTITPKITKSNYIDKSRKINTQFRIIKWNLSTYIMNETYYDSENDIIRFADNFNSGDEPKYHGRYFVSENKKLDTLKNELDLNQIPEKYHSYFLKTPIIAKIKSAKKIFDKHYQGETGWLIEIDKGSTSNVSNRLTFKIKTGGLSLDIDSVSSACSFGYYDYDFSLDRFPIGTELRTKWE